MQYNLERQRILLRIAMYEEMNLPLFADEWRNKLNSLYEETMSAIYQHGTKILLRNWIDHERMMQKLYADKRMAESQLTIIE